MRRFRSNKKITGFTIVELLVVIVVIGILATLGFVSYTGISKRAVSVSLQSDLVNAQKQLKLYLVDNEIYPNSVSDCPTPSAGNLCLQTSNGSSFSYTVDNSTNPKTYTLFAYNNETGYVQSSDSKLTAFPRAPLSPVADWQAVFQGDHFGNFFDAVTKSHATISRIGVKTTYDQNTKKIYDIPNNYLAILPRSDNMAGYEAVLEESRTNYLLNTSLEADSNFDGLPDSWSKNGGTLSTSLVDDGVYGNKAMKGTITTTGGPWRIYANTTLGSFSAGETAVLSFYVKSDTLTHIGGSGYKRLSVGISAYSSTNTELQLSGTVSGSISNNWSKVTCTFSNLPANTSYLQPRIGIVGVDLTTSDFYIDAIQLEKGNGASSYIPTTTSAVTRNADEVNIPTTGWSGANGTFLGVAGNSNVNVWSVILSWRTPTNDSAGLGRDTNTSLSSVINGGGLYATKSGRPIGYSVDAFRWGIGQPAYSYIDGSPGSGTANQVSLPTVNATGQIGGFNSNSTYHFNGPIQRAVIYSDTLSDSEINTVTNSVKDGPQ